MTDGLERELKLIPGRPELLDVLDGLRELGPYRVLARRRALQRNAFFDTLHRALGTRRVALRRRTVPGQALATWTLKTEGEHLRGIAVRPEVEAQLAADTSPALALGVLGQAARERGSAFVADLVSDALSSDELPLPAPYLELETDRRELDLDAPERGWRVELALDRVRLVGHPAFEEHEIEVELRRGSDDALEAARDAIATLGPTTPASASKLARALAHLETHLPGQPCRVAGVQD